MSLKKLIKILTNSHITSDLWLCYIIYMFFIDKEKASYSSKSCVRRVNWAQMKRRHSTVTAYSSKLQKLSRMFLLLLFPISRFFFLSSYVFTDFWGCLSCSNLRANAQWSSSVSAQYQRQPCGSEKPFLTQQQFCLCSTGLLTPL